MPGCENWNAVTVTFLTHSSTVQSIPHSVPPGVKYKETDLCNKLYCKLVASTHKS